MPKLITLALTTVFLFFSITKGTAQIVHGVVEGPDGKTVAGVAVRSDELAFRDSPSSCGIRHTDQSGQFTIEGFSTVLLLEKSGYTPFAINVKDQKEPLTLILSLESRKSVPQCSASTDGPVIRLESLRYSVPAEIHWERIQGDHVGFLLCLSGDHRECMTIVATPEYRTIPGYSQPGYDPRCGELHEIHPELSVLYELDRFKSESGIDWIDWSGHKGEELMRWFRGPNQVAQYNFVPNKMACVFDSIIDSVCREKNPEKDLQK